MEFRKIVFITCTVINTITALICITTFAISLSKYVSDLRKYKSDAKNAVIYADEVMKESGIYDSWETDNMKSYLKYKSKL